MMIYIYICVCVCVCVSLCTSMKRNNRKNTTEEGPGRVSIFFNLFIFAFHWISVSKVDLKFEYIQTYIYI